MNDIIHNKKWVYYLTRPNDLFSASLWQAWYESPDFEQIFHMKASDVLCIEELRGQVRQYRPRSQLIYLGIKYLPLVLFRKKYYEQLLEKGFTINKKARDVLEQGPKSFSILEESVGFLVRVALYATLLPNLPSLLFLDKLISKRVKKIYLELRSVSYYPEIIKQIVTPLAVERLGSSGVKRASELIGFITIKELIAGSKVDLLEREERQKKGQYFIYRQIHEKESVSWTEDPTRLLSQLEKGFEVKSSRQVAGKTAFPGRAQGLIKFVKNYDSDKNDFKEGDILLAVSTNPTMLPLMKKSRAIIADEGGITSHAAIVSRELKIPCIIGTKIATKIFRNGDMVEVDANKGIARKI